jgi:hypothetical protein
MIFKSDKSDESDKSYEFANLKFPNPLIPKLSLQRKLLNGSNGRLNTFIAVFPAGPFKQLRLYF